jgi:hypothetical protein
MDNRAAGRLCAFAADHAQVALRLRAPLDPSDAAGWETAAPTTVHSEDSILASAETTMPQVGAVVLSDYAKGTLTPHVIRAIIEAARRAPPSIAS